MLVGDFNMEPTKIPGLAKGISAGVDQEVSWALAAGEQPASTCKREWGSGGGNRRDFMDGCPLAAAAVVSCTVQAAGRIAPHLAVRSLFDYDRWSCRVTQPVRYSPLWPASWLPAVDKSGGSESVEVQRVWEIYDDFLQFMSRQDALLLDESLDAGDISQAWLVWSSVAETALADAYQFCVVLFRTEVWSWGVGRLVSGWSGLVDTMSGRCEVMLLMCMMQPIFSLYRDSSIAPLLDMRRRFKAVMDVFDSMISHGVAVNQEAGAP